MPPAFTRHARRLLALAVLTSPFTGAGSGAAATSRPGEVRTFDVATGELAAGLREVSRVSGREILFPADAVRGLRARALQGDYAPLAAARELLAGSGLTVIEDSATGALAVRPLAAGDGQPFTPEDAAAFRTTAAQPIRAHRGPLLRQLEPLLLQQARSLLARVRPVAGVPDAAEFPLPAGRAPSGEHGIRPGAHAAKGLALLVRLVPAEAFPADFSTEQARRTARSLLRQLVRTHGADGGMCADGRPWRHQWQSAYWAALAGEAAWLLWDDLDPDLQRGAARMVADEADRFVGLIPPAQRRTDSKAEENAWNSTVVSLAACQFPHHPRRPLWRETAVRWAVSAFARPDDLARAEMVDGRPLHAWLSGANLHDDFTLENHRRVHPDYMACTYLLTSQLPLYRWAGLPAPEALTRNVAAIGGALRSFAQPDGSLVYPNGQDWGLRRHADWFEYHATQAVLFGDRDAAALARAALETLTRMAARTPAGSIYLPAETKLSSDEAMALELPAHAYALLAERGEGPPPAPMTEVLSHAAGPRLFPDAKIAVHRTPTAFASMSWGAQVIGLVQPLTRDQLFSPESRSLVGHVRDEREVGDQPRAVDATWSTSAGAAGVIGVVRRAGDRVEQRFAMITLDDGVVLWADRLTAREAGTSLHMDLGTLGLLNDPAWPDQRGARAIHDDTGIHVAVATEAHRSPPWESTSPWLNLDDRFGIVRVAVSGRIRFQPIPSSAAGRQEQRLHFNASPHAVPALPLGDDCLAFGVALLLPGKTARETAAFAADTRIPSPPGARQLDVKLPDGRALRVDFERLTWRLAP